MATLSDALDVEVARYPTKRLADSAQHLIHRYRTGVDPASVVLDAEVTAAAYAAYRMPATHAAVTAALAEVAGLAPDFRPRTMVDVGGGTGAAVWAAAGVWSSLGELTVLDQSTQAMGLGKRLAEHADSPAVRGVRWQRAALGDLQVPPADLVTLSYVLSELTDRARAATVRAMATATLAVVVEPGTPAGYERIMAARDELLAAGMRVVAPCPHSGGCPIPRGQDWCHFAARLGRSPLHQRLKTASLNFEDEKFSYVAATREPWPSAPGRVLRHPLKRKGMVSLRLCGPEGLNDTIVSKRDPAAYRAARDTEWGDPWR
ncbi:ribosomal protein RSM22 (predicted rRNA methylase) [Actinokineospora baliensis]|uniref:small ribosomal subunit Rsm22 family protein n=1 Tax=Actinokineospora baliensis TaxID=547056 RepID=UPI001957B8D9|nr:small ribosomal subunit Rsm22 family protein [Actinokineospora baliensis]MBM7773641.1 ribosomal protein RSM22 (predicted rRNA methylase) [Actinokineospora baliensis]